jgi:ferredoxin--NADP+ reductase
MSTSTLRVAIVGSGPAGFYAAGHLLDAAAEVEVDMLERLPTPWGLVRLGVAPDHENIKAVSRVFDATAARKGFRFLGNVEVGRDLRHEELLELYDAVIYAVGAQTDRHLGIAGEDLPGSWPATAFVAWYNGHPDFQELPVDLNVERAVVIGNGNVAVDVARMLALTPDELAPTDTTEDAIAALVNSGITEIVMVGRRGPAQAAFTTPELKELGQLAGADIVVDPAEIEIDAASAASIAGDRAAQRNLTVLRDFATREPTGKPKRLRLRFLLSPIAIHGRERVESIQFVHNRLDADASGRILAVPTDHTETIECGLVLRSIGYRGMPVAGVPFDEVRGILRNEHGRVVDEDGDPVPRVYCTGWIKRGPTGIIGTNKKDAAETARLVLDDLATARLTHRPGATAAAVDAAFARRGVQPVTDAGWAAINDVETRRGKAEGRPRIKLCTWEQLLGAARHAGAGSQPAPGAELTERV